MILLGVPSNFSNGYKVKLPNTAITILNTPPITNVAATALFNFS